VLSGSRTYRSHHQTMVDRWEHRYDASTLRVQWKLENKVSAYKMTISRRELKYMAGGAQSDFHVDES